MKCADKLNTFGIFQRFINSRFVDLYDRKSRVFAVLSSSLLIGVNYANVLEKITLPLWFIIPTMFFSTISIVWLTLHNNIKTWSDNKMSNIQQNFNTYKNAYDGNCTNVTFD